jgi:L-amino acid N-acyltransferase YncA
MVAFSGSDPIGVLIGAKRPSGTLVHQIAVHPDHLRQGHGRHLLDSLGSKLAILGPPRIMAEVPETLAPACELFSASGYVQEALLTDYVLQSEENDAREAAGMSDDHAGQFVIPVTVDDLAANGLVDAHPQACWERSVETLTARKDDIAGLASASDEGIEAYLLYVTPGSSEPNSEAGASRLRVASARHAVAPSEATGAEAAAPANAEAGPRARDPAVEIVSLRSFVEDGGARLKQLLSRLRAQGMWTFRFPKVHPAEISKEFPETLGFRPATAHRLYAAKARSG